MFEDYRLQTSQLIHDESTKMCFNGRSHQIREILRSRVGHREDVPGCSRRPVGRSCDSASRAARAKDYPSPLHLFLLSLFLTWKKRNSFPPRVSGALRTPVIHMFRACTYERSRIPAIVIHTQRKRYKYYARSRARVRTRARTHM